MANKKDMKKYKIEKKERAVPKDEKHFFNYSELARKMWSDIVQKGHDAFNIKFDHENDDSSKERRIITLEVPDEYNQRTGKKKYQFKCDMHYAGGDWQESSCYFRCQLVDGSFYDMTRYPGNINTFGDSCFIYIPGPEGGNTHLDEGKEGGFVAINADSKNKPEELDTKRAWEHLGQYLSDLLVEYLKKKELAEMLDKNKDPVECDKAASVLDSIADKLEARGLVKEAARIDQIANTLEKLAVYDMMPGGAATKQLDQQERSFMQREAPGLMEAAQGIKGRQDHLVRQNLLKRYGPQIGQKFYDLAEAYAWNRAPVMNIARQWSDMQQKTMLQTQAVPAEKEDPFLPGGPVKKKPELIDTGQGFFLEKMAAKLETQGMHELSRKLRELGQHIVKYFQSMEGSIMKELTKKLDKIADRLEKKGRTKEAHDIDLISNTLEAASEEASVEKKPNQ